MCELAAAMLQTSLQLFEQLWGEDLMSLAGIYVWRGLAREQQIMEIWFLHIDSFIVLLMLMHTFLLC